MQYVPSHPLVEAKVDTPEPKAAPKPPAAKPKAKPEPIKELSLEEQAIADVSIDLNDPCYFCWQMNSFHYVPVYFLNVAGEGSC